MQGDDGQPANTKTVAELLAGFFHYFGWAFPYRTQVVCVRTGEPFPKTDYEPAQATKRSEWRFTIEVK